MLKLEGITKSFGDTLILDKFSLEDSSSHGIHCLLGRSGCGKTTLLRILADLEKLTCGKIEKPSAVSVVFQENRLLNQLTAIENLLAVNPDRGRALRLLDLFELSEYAASLPTQMSGGQKRRLAIARAMLFPHELLLLDEPFKGLDLPTKGLIVKVILEEEQGKKMILVTHDVQEAARLASVVTIFSGTPLIPEENYILAEEPLSRSDEYIAEHMEKFSLKLEEIAGKSKKDLH